MSQKVGALESQLMHSQHAVTAAKQENYRIQQAAAAEIFELKSELARQRVNHQSDIEACEQEDRRIKREAEVEISMKHQDLLRQRNANRTAKRDYDERVDEVERLWSFQRKDMQDTNNALRKSNKDLTEQCKSQEKKIEGQAAAGSQPLEPRIEATQKQEPAYQHASRPGRQHQEVSRKVGCKEQAARR